MDKNNYQICASCGTKGESLNFHWMAYAIFCNQCIQEFKRQNFIKPMLYRETHYEVTELGGEKFPQWKLVTHCSLDGTPIYKHMIDKQMAKGIIPCCPFCTTKINI